eukprot:scaffold261_cov336-Pavlova_lutheri.AAC.20
MQRKNTLIGATAAFYETHCATDRSYHDNLTLVLVCLDDCLTMGLGLSMAKYEKMVLNESRRKLNNTTIAKSFTTPTASKFHPCKLPA